jgi:hypothetical protein
MGVPAPGPFLVGRNEEVGLLRRCWEQSKEGLGQVVLVSGCAGEGFRLLAEALVVVDTTGVRDFKAAIYRLQGELLLARLVDNNLFLATRATALERRVSTRSGSPISHRRHIGAPPHHKPHTLFTAPRCPSST